MGSMKEPFRDAARAQLSLLAPLEKRVLVWIARRLPAWVNSDHLTALGFLALAGAGAAYALAPSDTCWLHVVNLCLLLNWFGDSTDGTLARVRNHLRPRYGFYVDHAVDAVGTMLLLGGMGLSGYMSTPVAAALIIAYFLLSIETYLATYTIGTFHLSFGGFSPTELRILLVIGNLYVLFRPATVRLAGQPFLLFDVGAVVGIAGMLVIVLYHMVSNTRRLYREERLPG